jgi:hypothetical protein
MNGTSADSDLRVRVDREYQELLAAITLVASGGSRRVTVSNLRFAAELLPEVERLGRERRVRIVPVWPAEDSGPWEVTVERVDPDA